MHCGPKIKGFTFKMLTIGLLQILLEEKSKKKKHLTQLQWQEWWVIKWETRLEIILLVIFSCCHFKSLPMILSCLWKVFVLTDKIFLNCLSTVSLSHDIQILSIFPFLVASAFKCYSPLSSSIYTALFKVIQVSSQWFIL